MTTEEKRLLLREAMVLGVPKRKLDQKCRGAAALVLFRGRTNTPQKIDEMYENLLKFRNNGGSHSKAPSGEKREELSLKVKEQELEITALKSRLDALEKTIQRQEKEKNEKKKQGKKVLGVPITQKTDVVGGRKYVRWYGYIHQNGKRRWIYIGKDVSLAEAKIKAFLEKEKTN